MLTFLLWFLGCYPSALAIAELRPSFTPAEIFVTMLVWPIVVVLALIGFLFVSIRKFFTNV